VPDPEHHRPDGGALGMTGSLVSFQAMEEGLNERNAVAKVLSDPEGRARRPRWPIRARPGRFTPEVT
jgi:hypothetical protein